MSDDAKFSTEMTEVRALAGITPKYEVGRVNESLANGTVASFMAVLTSKLTQYDMKLGRKERLPNMYRLGHYLGAANKVEQDVHRYMRKDDKEALEAMKKSLEKRFILRDMPPARNVVRQIDKFLATGKKPSLTAR